MIVERISYIKNPTDDRIYREIKNKANLYFKEKGMSKFGNNALFFRGTIFLSLAIIAYVSLLNTTTFLNLQISYLLLGFSLIILGMTLGHDAAHNCLTGKGKLDNVLFSILFGLQGMNPSLWKIKHNSSHHPFPNVTNMDSDLEVTSFLRLSPYQKRKEMHKYQHIYAPLLYLFASLIYIFIYDLKMPSKNKYGNLYLNKSRVRLERIIIMKLLYISLYLIIPYCLLPFSFAMILVAFLVMHALLSLFITFTFFISHHVTVANYTDIENDKPIKVTWLVQQITSTVDFHPHSRFFNYLFGGFHAHVAHHLFPGISHVHYPDLTYMIRSVLKENDISYHAVTYWEGIKSHMVHLKNLGQA